MWKSSQTIAVFVIEGMCKRRRRVTLYLSCESGDCSARCGTLFEPKLHTPSWPRPDRHDAGPRQRGPMLNHVLLLLFKTKKSSNNYMYSEGPTSSKYDDQLGDKFTRNIHSIERSKIRRRYEQARYLFFCKANSEFFTRGTATQRLPPNANGISLHYLVST